MRCAQCHDLIVDAFFDELEPGQRMEFDTHVASCEACKKEYNDITVTLSLMGKRERRDPGDIFWDGYWDRLQPRLHAAQDEVESSDTSEQSWWRKRVAGASTQRMSWAYRTVAAASILVIGMFAGRTFLAPQPQQTLPSDPIAFLDSLDDPGSMDARVASTPDQRAMRYVARSQMLLLALVNTDASDDGYAASISSHKERSSRLVGEAEQLKQDLDSPKQRRLRELVSQLEKILKEIANLEADDDIEAVEFIRGNVNSHDIMLEINLEQLRHGTDEDGLRSGTTDAPQESDLKGRI